MSQIAQTHSRLARPRLNALAILALGVLALVPATQATAATAGAVDLRSPDARDAARQAHTATIVDLRSPDARDAAHAVNAARTVDLSSPDARDAARPIPSVASSPGQTAGGFNWGYAAIGGALIVLLGVAGVARRRRAPQHSPVPIQS